MNEPSVEKVLEKSIKLLLQSMEDMDNCLPLEAESRIAMSIILLNQIACVSDFGSYELNGQYSFCRNFVVEK